MKVRVEYQYEINKAIEGGIESETLNIDEQWEQFKRIILGAARRVCRISKQIGRGGAGR